MFDNKKDVERLRRENTGIDERGRFEKIVDSIDLPELLFFGFFGLLFFGFVVMAIWGDPTPNALSNFDFERIIDK
jgi:hypothetical protein